VASSNKDETRAQSATLIKGLLGGLICLSSRKAPAEADIGRVDRGGWHG
jgi:hypothetical protein